MRPVDEVCLVLAGGNALGAYAAGAIEALCEAGVRPDLVSGASIGAVTGALLAGNPPDRWVERLQDFWHRARSPSLAGLFGADTLPGLAGPGTRAAHALHTLAVGRPGLFHPSVDVRLWPWGRTEQSTALFDNHPLLATLHELLDFGHLNGGGTPLVISAMDVLSGQDHRLCIAVDLFAPEGALPRSFDDALARAQDLAFSAQTQRTLAAFRSEQRLRHRLAQFAPDATPDEPAPGQVDVLLCAYHAPRHELGAKTLEFSPASLQERWAAGRRDLARLLDRYRNEAAPDVQDLGFSLYRTPPV